MRWLARLGSELRRAPGSEETERAIAALAIHDAAADAIARELSGVETVGLVDRTDHPRGEPLASAKPREMVQLAAGIYTSVPGKEGRVRLLTTLRAIAPRILVHVPVIDENSHVGRVVVDAPRRLLRAASVPVPEPGDRFGPRGYAHCFFDEEPLYAEIAEAGLAPVARRGFTFLLEHTGGLPIEHLDPFPVEVARAAALAREVERARLRDTPERALAAMRARGLAHEARGPVARARLRRAISWVDAAMGASCYRRVLLELALDAGAARERVVFGLDVGRTGHAAFEHREDRTFDVVFTLGPEDG